MRWNGSLVLAFLLPAALSVQEPPPFARPAIEPTPAVCPEPAPSPWLAIPALVTAYTPGPESCGDFADGKTSILRNTDEHPYGVAADPRIMPYGARVVVPGYLPLTKPNHPWDVDDTGSAMRKSWRKDGVVHLDLRFKTVHSARQWGERWMTVWVDCSSLPADKVQRLITYRSRFP